MGKSRRNVLFAAVLGVGALKAGGDYFANQPAEGSDNQSNEGTDGVDTDDLGSLEDLQATPTPQSDTLYHERQNVLLQPGQGFAETFRNTGENTLRVRIPEFPTVGGFAGLYTYQEWTRIRDQVEQGGDWETGDPLGTVPVDPEQSVYEFPVEMDGRYALVLQLRESYSETNVEFEYWVLD